MQRLSVAFGCIWFQMRVKNSQSERMWVVREAENDAKDLSDLQIRLTAENHLFVAPAKSPFNKESVTGTCNCVGDAEPETTQFTLV